jgi:hypothetical protein
MVDQQTTPVEAAVLAVVLSPVPATRLALQRRRTGGFTLAELLVTVGVLVLVVLLFTQLLNSAATITTLGHKQMDADSQARQLLDRMAIDFAQMLKRSDVDYYLKSSATATGVRKVLQPGNDQIAFYSAVPGYYPPTGSQSPVSLVAYRVYNPSPTPSPCPNCNKLERMGKGLVWDGVSTNDTPVVFMPIPVASPIPTGELPSPPNPLPTPAWPQAGNMNTDSTYEVVSSQVFRFEYYYLLKNGTLSATPWFSTPNFSAMQDVAAIVVVIAVIDSKSKVLLTDAQMATLAGTLIDYGGSAAAGCPTPNWQTPGQLRRQWQCVLDGTNGLPRSAVSGIRLYERYFYMSQ